MRRALLLLLLPLGIPLLLGAGEPVKTSDRIAALTEYHGYYPCMDCHADQVSNPQPRILVEEHEVPLAWEDADGNAHVVEFGELVPIAQLLGQADLPTRKRSDMLRIGERLNIREYMVDNDLAPSDSVWVLEHGGANLWCLDCHDSRDRDKLRKLTGGQLTFNESQLLCGQCHGPILSDWEHGVHGKTTGYWDRSRDVEGISTRMLCVECHIAHAPRFRGMMPLAAPVTRIDNISHPGHREHEVDERKLDRDVMGPHPWAKTGGQETAPKSGDEEEHH